MTPYLPDEVIDKETFLSQLTLMEQQKRTLLANDCKDKSTIGFAYDSGYLACLTEIRYIVNLLKSKQPETEEDEDE